MSTNANNWIEAYETQKAVIAHYTSPTPPPAAANTPAERDSLNRLQLILIWFASVLIAVTLYTQIIARFG